MHLGASQNTIGAAAADRERRWKAKKPIPPRNVHTAKVARYLQAWGRFEGWTGSPGREAQRRKRHFLALSQVGTPGLDHDRLSTFTRGHFTCVGRNASHSTPSGKVSG